MGRRAQVGRHLECERDGRARRRRWQTRACERLQRSEGPLGQPPRRVGHRWPALCEQHGAGDTAHRRAYDTQVHGHTHLVRLRLVEGLLHAVDHVGLHRAVKVDAEGLAQRGVARRVAASLNAPAGLEGEGGARSALGGPQTHLGHARRARVGALPHGRGGGPAVRVQVPRHAPVLARARAPEAPGHEAEGVGVARERDTAHAGETAAKSGPTSVLGHAHAREAPVPVAPLRRLRLVGEDHHLVVDLPQERAHVVAVDHVLLGEQQAVLHAIVLVHLTLVEEGVRVGQSCHEGNHIVGLHVAVEVLHHVCGRVELVVACRVEGLRVDAAERLEVPLLRTAGGELACAQLLPQALEAQELSVRQVAQHIAVGALGEASGQLHGEHGYGVAADHGHGHPVLEAEGIAAARRLFVKRVVDCLVRVPSARHLVPLQPAHDGDGGHLLEEELLMKFHEVRHIAEGGDEHEDEGLGRRLLECGDEEGRPILEGLHIHLRKALHPVLVGLGVVGPPLRPHTHGHLKCPHVIEHAPRQAGSLQGLLATIGDDCTQRDAVLVV
mmetsp:Transcript_8642/g.25523  ORF Transcript_8642/g.25523 Transcript_8642/m.25523 type:complete len:554 (-) Transcript_8642:179-1840(-)